jgi:hypothetical protein
MTRLIQPIVKAQIHLETAKAILHSALRWGTIGQIAAKAGISAAYLSRLQRPEANSPSPQVAALIAKHTHLPPEQQQDLLEHWLLARENQTLVAQFAKQDKDWLGYEAIGELYRAHWLATYSKTPHEAQIYYRATQTLGQALAQEFSLATYPLAAARTHTLLHDIFCVFNRPGTALYHAKMARAILDYVEDDSLYRKQGLIFYNFQKEQEEILDYYELQVNAIRSEAVSYNHLGLHGIAQATCERALKNEAVNRNPTKWKVHILRDSINALSRNPRTGSTDLEECAYKGRSICEANNDELGLLLIHNYLAQGYLLRGQHKKAKGILNQELFRIDHSTEVGQLHKCLILRGLATLHRMQGNKAEWEFFVTQTLSIAQEAGLSEISGKLHQEYGNEPEYMKIRKQIESAD